MTSREGSEGAGSKLEEQGLLFSYTAQLLLIAVFLELVLYRLASRLGMHLSKVAQKHESVRLTFKVLSSLGFTLLNFVAMLVFLALLLLLLNKCRGIGGGRFDRALVPVVAFLLALTVSYLLFPPAMLGAVLYNVVVFASIVLLVAEYLLTHQTWAQRAMVISFALGLTGWLYYQTISTVYGLLEQVSAPPLAHEVNRVGEALMVVASMLAFGAYGTTPFRTRNTRQRRRAVVFMAIGGAAFVALLFMDYLLEWINPSIAESARKAGEGIGWVFQMGMGYTFFLPFALYVAGLLCWAYTVVKLAILANPAGIGLGVMFMAGYALQLSHLALMVVLGLMVLNLDRRHAVGSVQPLVDAGAVIPSTGSLVGERS